jgi:predicted pyridoxine 5'-phosphate oxidase superfamily flavin-nucleotide-binding protein
MAWQTFERSVPDLAKFAREQFEESRLALIGTIRSDGTPRISCIEPYILDGTLYLGMMWQSRKALDLLRDPRMVLRNAICTNTGDEVEISLRGQVVEIRDLEVRRRYVEASETAWKEPHFHLFAVEVESAALVRYGGGQQSVKLWPQNREFKRPYG